LDSVKKINLSFITALVRLIQTGPTKCVGLFPIYKFKLTQLAKPTKSWAKSCKENSETIMAIPYQNLNSSSQITSSAHGW